MATKLLHIDSSLFSESGHSSQLGKQLIGNLAKQLDAVDISYRDLAKQPIPHFTAETIAAIGEGKAELADALIEEVQNADIIVLGVPMYNFMIPSSLKAWFDHIARAGVTFKYTDQGPVGLLENKKVFVLTTRGGVHKGQASDLVTPYLKIMLNFIGLGDVEFIYAEGLNMSEMKEENLQRAQQETQTAQINGEAA